MKVKGYELALTAVCTALGALLMIQLKTQQNLRIALPTHQASDLALMLREQQQAREALEKDIVQVRRERLNLNAQTQLKKLKGLLGLTAVEGPGLSVTLRPQRTARVAERDAYVDPLWIDTIVNELWSAGAEAVAINDQRIVTNTGIAAAPSGYAVLVNGQPVTSPFTILAIGDGATLDSALRMRNSAVDLLRFYDLSVSLVVRERIVLPAYTGPLHYTFFTAPDGQERR